MKRIIEILQAFVRSGGFFVLFRGHLHVERLVGSVGVVVVDEVIEARLLDEEVLCGGLGGLLLQG